jgi:hypothetical protein
MAEVQLCHVYKFAKKTDAQLLPHVNFMKWRTVALPCVNNCKNGGWAALPRVNYCKMVDAQRCRMYSFANGGSAAFATCKLLQKWRMRSFALCDLLHKSWVRSFAACKLMLKWRRRGYAACIHFSNGGGAALWRVNYCKNGDAQLCRM